MKKHSFIDYDLNISVKLSPTEKKLILKYLDFASMVLEESSKNKIFPKNLKRIHISILICGDLKIKRLNNQFRNKDKVTDVLSFPAIEDLRKNSNKSSNFSQIVFIGDLAICYPQAKRQAKKFFITPIEEFIHLYFHGVLHLLGYDHEISKREEIIMQKAEDWCLSKLVQIKKGA